MGNPQGSDGVWFPDWERVLGSLRLPEHHRLAYRQAIVGFLGFCRKTRQRATVVAARQFIEQVQAQRRLGESQLGQWKEALNWFFKTGRSAGQSGVPPSRPEVRTADLIRTHRLPPPAATDLGGPGWEQKLIRELRSRNYGWRTEQTYRMWAGRFAGWLKRRGARGVLEAGEMEVRDYLSDLATEQRVAVATQRQAFSLVEG